MTSPTPSGLRGEIIEPRYFNRVKSDREVLSEFKQKTKDIIKLTQAEFRALTPNVTYDINFNIKDILHTYSKIPARL